MNADQTEFEIARRGGHVEARDGDRLVVSSGGTNHALHFVLGIFTLGLWWVFVWIPISIAGGRKRRVVYANTPESDVRLPHELPRPFLTTVAAIIASVVVYALSGNIVLVVIVVCVLGAAVRAIANSR
jgi:hypothetical protein